MARYVVTGACVQVRTVSPDGSPVLVYRYKGDPVEITAADATHLLSVGLIERAADVTSDPVVNPGPGDVGERGPGGVHPAGRPAEDADKADWVAYAVTQGLSAEDAEAADVVDLVAIYGDQTPPQRPAPPVTLTRPQTDGSKADWVAYAVQQGIDRAEAEKMTRDKLAADDRLK